MEEVMAGILSERKKSIEGKYTPPIKGQLVSTYPKSPRMFCSIMYLIMATLLN